MLKVWEREGYTVETVEFDYNLHHFAVIKNDEVVVTIVPHTIEDMEQIMEDLDNGDDVNGWEDGNGGTVSV